MEGVLNILPHSGPIREFHLTWNSSRSSQDNSNQDTVPPSRSVFPDYGPYTDFFGKTGPDLVCIVCEKSDFLLMLLWLGESS